MEPSNINEVIGAAWDEVVPALAPKAQRLDIDREIRRATGASMRDAKQHLAPWLLLLDEALRVDLALYELIDPFADKRKSSFPMSFVTLVARATALTLAVRHLVPRGLEDAARPLVRSLIETQELALVALADKQFDRDYFEAEDEEAFWLQCIARGQLESRLSRALGALSFSDDERRELLNPRRDAKRNLSGAVHSSASSAFRSVFVPSLAHPGRLVVTSALGHVSAHTPGLIALVCAYTRVFAAAVFKMVQRVPELDRAFRESNRVKVESFLAASLVLQDAEQWCDGNLHADFDDLWTCAADGKDSLDDKT